MSKAGDLRHPANKLAQCKARRDLTRSCGKFATVLSDRILSAIHSVLPVTAISKALR